LNTLMAIPLKFELIKSIVDAGAACPAGHAVDPSLNPDLRDAGVALVTTYVEQLALLGIVGDPKPLFGKNGGMWIGYSLTERGRELAPSEVQLRRAVAEITGGPRTEVSESVAMLLEECRHAQINEIYRDDFLRSLEEIGICFDQGCFIATIGLCGKILEVCLKELLLRNDIRVDPNFMVGKLIKTIRERVVDEYLDPALLHVVNIINMSRITAVHANERIPVPSRDQAIMVIFATRDVVRRNLSHA